MFNKQIKMLRTERAISDVATLLILPTFQWPIPFIPEVTLQYCTDCTSLAKGNRALGQVTEREEGETQGLCALRCGYTIHQFLRGGALCAQVPPSDELVAGTSDLYAYSSTLTFVGKSITF